MRSDGIFDSLYLGRCLRFGWHMDVVLFLLLGDASLMLGGDLVMDVDNCFIIWMIFDAVWPLILLCISYHTGAYSPFIWLRWALTLSLDIFIDRRSLMEYVEMISILVEHCWAHWRFSWFWVPFAKNFWDGLVDYCWVGDSWLMMLDSFFVVHQISTLGHISLFFRDP